MRFDMYASIHKAQRNHLFQLSIQIGKTDFTDPAQVSSVTHKMEHMITHIRQHALNEEMFIHPLFSVCKEQCALLDSQHVQIEALLDELEEIIKTNLSDRLYVVFNRFIAIYLQHTDLEETIQKDVLWTHYSDDDLKAIMHQYSQSLTWQKTLEGMAFMIPSLNASEVEKMLSRMKPTLPEDKFQQILRITEPA